MITRWLGIRPHPHDAPRRPVEIAGPREIVHIIERRIFAGDVRRHFVGEVERCTTSALRVRGHLFVYDSALGAFVKKRELRTRIFPLDNRIILNVLPEETHVADVRYDYDEEGNLSLVDGGELELDVSEFSSRE